jgi:hypothetical protein
MDIIDCLKLISDSQVVLILNKKGELILVKNAERELEIKTEDDCFNILFNLFKQETGLKIFDSAFKQEFDKLILRHSKRIKYEDRTLSS